MAHTVPTRVLLAVQRPQVPTTCKYGQVDTVGHSGQGCTAQPAHEGDPRVGRPNGAQGVTALCYTKTDADGYPLVDEPVCERGSNKVPMAKSCWWHKDKL